MISLTKPGGWIGVLNPLYRLIRKNSPNIDDVDHLERSFLKDLGVEAEMIKIQTHFNRFTKVFGELEVVSRNFQNALKYYHLELSLEDVDMDRSLVIYVLYLGQKVQ